MRKAHRPARFVRSPNTICIKKGHTWAGVLPSEALRASDAQCPEVHQMLEGATILRWQTNRFWGLMRHTKGVLRYAHDWRH